MKTLMDHYHEGVDRLQGQLKEAETTEQAVSIVQDELRKLADIDGAYMQSLTVPEARISQAMLSTLRLCLNTLTSIRLQALHPDQYSSTQPEPISESSRETSMLGEVVSGALGAGITGAVTGGPLGLGLGLVVGGAVGGGVARFSKGADTLVSQVRSEEPKLGLGVDVDAFLGQLVQALEKVDVTVSRYRVEEEEDARQKKPKLEDHPEVLEFLQNLMGDALDEDTPLPRTIKMRNREIPRILRHYGIQAEVYQPDGEQTSAVDAYSKFEFEPSLDPDSEKYVILKPAFVKGDRVILRGRVIEPASFTQE